MDIFCSEFQKFNGAKFEFGLLFSLVFIYIFVKDKLMASQSAELEIKKIGIIINEVILLRKETDLRFKETVKQIKDAFDLL